MNAVTVIIPNWNGCELLETVCLPSLQAQTCESFAVLVVDNGSTDGSVTALRERWPSVRVLELDSNHGFAGAVNRGIAAAATPYVALLNNDVEVSPSWLDELVVAIEARPDAGSVVGTIYDFSRRDVIAAAGDVVTTLGGFFPRGYGETDAGQYDEPARVTSACAGAALYRRAALDDVGPFDEDFFAYGEDVDWGLRAQLRGYSCWFVPGASAYHIGGATTTTGSIRHRAWLSRNSLWVLVKTFPTPLLLKNGPAITWKLAQRFYGLWRMGEHGVAARTSWDAVRFIPRMRGKRRAIYARRQITDADFIRALRPESLRSDKVDALRRMARRRAS